MELQIAGKGVEVTTAVREYAERKLGRLVRHLPNIVDLRVEITAEPTKSPLQRFTVQVTADSSGTLLRGEERGEDIYTAVDRVAAIMDRQIEHFKGRRYHKGRGNSVAKAAIETDTEPEPRRVVKVKRFAVKPMSVEEAIDQMELLGHDFYLFFNASSEELNLLYRRKDNDYGLIEPELG